MKAGFAVCDITPKLGIYLTGYGQPERLATGVHSPLNASVMVLQDDEKTAVIIGFDWCFVDWPLTQKIRKGIHDATGIPEKHILCCCSHTHSAPHTTYMRTLGRSAVDPENAGVQYVIDSIPIIAECVRQAVNNLRPCKAGFAHTKTNACVSRRGTDENGRVAGFIGDPDQIHDDNMTIVHFLDAEDGKDLGIFVHCGGHNTSMGASLDISSDWCGIMKDRIHDKYQVPVVFVNGALGDMGPRTSRWVPSCDGFSGHGFAAGGGGNRKAAEEVGYRAAADALVAMEGLRDYRDDLPLAIHVGELRLPQALSMTESQALDVLKDFDAAEEDAKAEPNVKYQIAKAILGAWKEPIQDELVVEQVIVSFGPVALVPFPFEVFSIFTLRLRKYGPFEYNLLCSNTNGRNAYLPDRGAFAMGGYEPSCLKTIRLYVVKPEAGDVAVTQSLASLREIL